MKHTRLLQLLVLAACSAHPAVAQEPGQPWTADGIARLGASGIQQGSFPDCWFEASLAEMARLPRGQARLAEMISYAPDRSWIVRFPDNGSTYPVSMADIRAMRLRDSALWAKVLECAQLKRFPHGEGANDPETGRGHLESGLHCLTGNMTESAKLKEIDDQQLSSFIYSAVRSQNPIICGSRREVRKPFVAGHVYSITDIDLAHGVVVVRNPWGSNPGQQRGTDRRRAGFLRMPIREFRDSFWVVSRSAL